jgi:hypothetical protein
MIVLDQVDHYGKEIERTSELVSKLSLRFNCSISRIFIGQSHWQNADTPLLRNVRAEAISA